MARKSDKSGGKSHRKPITIGKRHDAGRTKGGETKSATSRPAARKHPNNTRPKSRKPAARRKSSAGKSPKRHGWFGRLVYFGAIASLWMGIMAAGVLVYFARDLPDTSKIWQVDRQPSITFLDIHGNRIATRGATYAPPAKLSELPPSLPAAVISVEDKRFYHHFGIDPIGLARAMWVNARAGHIVQGGSTLTQQLAKNLFLTNDRTYKRKIQEVLLALWLEHKFSKDEILSVYLNRVYFGRGAWGVEAASEAYFNKPVKDLSLGESAMIAGLLKAPNRYSPTSDLTRAERRATVVLDVMVKTGKITAKQRQLAFNTPIRVKPVMATPSSAYFVDWLASQVRKRVGEVKTDLIVQTTLDVKAQRAAEKSMKAHMNAKAAKAGATQGGLIALGPHGAVRAMVGGKDYSKSQFNRATQARRQPGSAFKPFVYLAALEAGMTPWTVRTDQPVHIGDWSPTNYENEYDGDMSLTEALYKSVNTVAVQVAEEVGRGKVAALAHRMGLMSPVATTRSMSLGSNGTSLIDLAGAYAPFANGGYLARPFGMTEIKVRKGPVLWQRKALPPAPVMSANDNAAMDLMLRAVVTKGTGRRARIPGQDVAGKTGTTNDFRDAWFLGFTKGRTAGVWVGDDSNRHMQHVTGGKLPTEIWHDFMVGWLAADPVLPEPVPAPEVASAESAVTPQQTTAKAAPAPRKDELGDLLTSLSGKLE